MSGLATITLPPSELAKFSQAMRDVVTVSGKSAEEVTRGFAGRILKRWAGKTKVVPENIVIWRARTKAAVSSDASQGKQRYTTVNTGRRGGESGRVWFRTRGNKFSQAGVVIRDDTAAAAFVPSWMHYKTADWNDINYTAAQYAAKLRQYIPMGLRAIGLARQSVIQIADALGIDLSKIPGGGISSAGITKARKAIASNGRTYANGTGTAQHQAQRFFIELVNHYPGGAKIGMDVTLATVIGGEIKYYERNLAEGVFLAQQRVARAYPFLQVQKTAA